MVCTHMRGPARARGSRVCPGPARVSFWGACVIFFRGGRPSNPPKRTGFPVGKNSHANGWVRSVHAIFKTFPWWGTGAGNPRACVPVPCVRPRLPPQTRLTWGQSCHKSHPFPAEIAGLNPSIFRSSRMVLNRQRLGFYALLPQVRSAPPAHVPADFSPPPL